MIVGAEGPVVLLPGRMAARLAHPLRLLLEAERRNGARPDDEIERIVSEVERVGAEYRSRAAEMAAEMTAAVVGSSELPGSATGDTVAYMTSAEVAALLGCEPRNVTDLAFRRSLQGRKTASGWRFDPADVAAFIADRESVA